jgi:hypothetical protein
MSYAPDSTKVVLKNREFWLSGTAFGLIVFLWLRFPGHSIDVVTGYVFLAYTAVTFLILLKWAIRVYKGKPAELQLAYELGHSGTCKRHARYNCKTCRRWQQNGSRCAVLSVAAATLFVLLGLGISAFEFNNKLHEPDADDDVQTAGYGLINSSAIGLYTVCGIILILIVSSKNSRQPEEWNWDRNNPPDMRFTDEPLELTWRRVSGGGPLPILDSAHIPLLQIGFYSGWSVVVARSLSPVNFGLLRITLTSMTLFWIATHWTFKYRGLTQGLRTIDPALRRRVERIRIAAVGGDVDAEYALAVCLETGRGVLIDKDEALQWYNKAAQEGHVEAQNWIGLFYLYRRDAKQAEEWFHKSAMQGHVPAFVNLAHLYAYGPDELLAVNLYNDSTSTGNLVQQQAAAGMLANARRQPKEYERAYFWLSLTMRYAADYKETDEIERERAEIAMKVSPERQAEIHTSVDNWPGPTRSERELMDLLD